jgi:hypothetical protein
MTGSMVDGPGRQDTLTKSCTLARAGSVDNDQEAPPLVVEMTADGPL